MKKFMYVLTLMFAMVLMSTSCEKQNDDVLIPTDLIGAKWNCTSLNYAGSVYTASVAPTFATLNLTKEFVCLNFQFNSNLTVTLSTKYTGSTVLGNVNNSDNWSSGELGYSITGTTLFINDCYEFEIISHSASELKLKMINQWTTEMPKDGIYTLTR